MAVITSDDEWAKVVDQVDNSRLDPWLWLGGSDEETEGEWKWVTGEDFFYQRWRGGQPDNGGGTEHSLHTRSVNGEWNDDQGYHEYDYLLEIEKYKLLVFQVDLMHLNKLYQDLP